MEQNQNNYTVENSPVPMRNKGLEIPTLILGIVSIASSSIGLSFSLASLGVTYMELIWFYVFFFIISSLVCGIVDLELGSKYKKEYNTINNMVNIGNGLSIGGIIMSAVSIMIFVCVISLKLLSVLG